MGCLFSHEEDRREPKYGYSVSSQTHQYVQKRQEITPSLQEAQREPSHSLPVALRTSQHVQRRQETIPSFRVDLSRSQPLFAEFKCTCGRFWNSRLTWNNTYQVCKRCKRQVYPINQRALRPEDMSGDKDAPEHPREFCQKCKQLGEYCGKKQNVRHRLGRPRNYRKEF